MDRGSRYVESLSKAEISLVVWDVAGCLEIQKDVVEYSSAMVGVVLSSVLVYLQYVFPSIDPYFGYIIIGECGRYTVLCVY